VLRAISRNDGVSIDMQTGGLAAVLPAGSDSDFESTASLR
jgi:hypothetical protein